MPQDSQSVVFNCTNYTVRYMPMAVDINKSQLSEWGAGWVNILLCDHLSKTHSCMLLTYPFPPDSSIAYTILPLWHVTFDGVLCFNLYPLYSGTSDERTPWDQQFLPLIVLNREVSSFQWFKLHWKYSLGQEIFAFISWNILFNIVSLIPRVLACTYIPTYLCMGGVTMALSAITNNCSVLLLLFMLGDKHMICLPGRLVTTGHQFSLCVVVYSQSTDESTQSNPLTYLSFCYNFIHSS